MDLSQKLVFCISGVPKRLTQMIQLMACAVAIGSECFLRVLAGSRNVQKEAMVVKRPATKRPASKRPAKAPRSGIVESEAFHWAQGVMEEHLQYLE